MKANHRFILVTHGTFFLTGIVTTMLGPLLPELIRRWTLTDGQAGALFLAQSLGSLAGILSSSRLMLRLGFLRSLALGTGFMTVGAAGLSLSQVPAAVAAIGVYGIGLGITIPAVNLLIAHRFPQRRAAALNLLNLCWCIGAVVSPPIIAWCLVNGYMELFLWTLAAFLLLALGLLSIERRQSRGASPARPSPRSLDNLDDTPRVLIALLLFLYVSSEIGTAGWIPTYAQRIGVSEFTWSWLQSTFWGALLLGRALSPSILRTIQAPWLVMAGLLTALAGEAVFLVSSQLEILFVGVTLTGLGLSPIYPTTIAVYSEFYGDQASARSTPVFAMASLGGALGPWVIGFSSEWLGGLRHGMTLLIAAMMLMLALQAQVLRLWRRRGHAASNGERVQSPATVGSRSENL